MPSCHYTIAVASADLYPLVEALRGVVTKVGVLRKASLEFEKDHVKRLELGGEENEPWHTNNSLR